MNTAKGEVDYTDLGIRGTSFGTSFYDDHEPAAMTMGEFIELLVDGGPSDIAIVQISRNGIGESHPKNGFIMEVKLALVPNGMVLDYLSTHKVVLINKVLALAMEEGLVK